MICGSEIVARIDLTRSDLKYLKEMGKFLNQNKIISNIKIKN